MTFQGTIDERRILRGIIAERRVLQGEIAERRVLQGAIAERRVLQGAIAERRVLRGTIAEGVRVFPTGLFSILSTIFDGVDEDILIASDPSLNQTTDLSVAFWVKALAPPNISHLIAKRFAGSPISWVVTASQPGGGVRVILDKTGGGTLKDFRTTGIDFFDNAWHLFVLSWQSSTLTLYGDAVAQPVVKSTDNAGAAINVTTAPVIMGSRFGLISFFPGQLDEVTLWKRGFSSAEVVELYNGGTPLDPSTHSAAVDLVSPWRMGDNDTFPTIADGVGPNDGTMRNMETGDFILDAPP